MNTSFTEFRATVLENILELLWRQWSALGVSGSSQFKQQSIVDPEALLLLTLTAARYDVRLFDEVINWVELNGAFLNVNRLKNLIHRYDFQAKPQISALAKRMGQKSDQALKWKSLSSQYSADPSESLFFQHSGKPFPHPDMPDPIDNRHGLIRSPFTSRKLVQKFPSAGAPSLLLRLRALLGINIRCEIFCVLGSVDEIHPSLLAKRITHAPRSTQKALAEMVLSGVIRVRTRSREKLYSLESNALAGLLHPDDEKTRWDDFAPTFRALEILWLSLTHPDQHILDESLLASQWRRIARDMSPLLGEGQWGQPLRHDSRFQGVEYAEVFTTDIRQLFKHLNS